MPNWARNTLLVLGLVVMTIGVLTGLYVAIWWGWIGGIVGIVEAIKANPVNSMDLTLGIVRLLFANFIGAVVGWLIFSFGAWIGSLGVDSFRRPRARKW